MSSGKEWVMGVIVDFTEPLKQAEGMKFWRKPLDLDKHKVIRGKVHFIEERCKECNFCIEFCPREVLQMSDHFNKRGYRPPEVAKGQEDRCTACRHCEDICPEFAIYIVEEDP